MKRKALISIVFASSYFCALAEWAIEATKDPITDKYTVSMATVGTPDENKIGMKAPSIAVICLQPTNENGVPKGAYLVALNAPGVDIDIMRGTASLIFRIDSEPAEKFETKLVGENFITFPRPRDLTERMKKASKMLVRYNHMFYGTITATIDLSDFSESYQKFRKKILEVGTVVESDSQADMAKAEPEPETQQAEKKESFEEHQARVIEKVKSYVVPKLKTKTTFKPGTVDIRELNGVTLWVVHFAADKRKWRMGVKEFADGKLEIVQPSQLSSLIKNSSPSY